MVQLVKAELEWSIPPKGIKTLQGGWSSSSKRVSSKIRPYRYRKMPKRGLPTLQER